MDIFLTGGNGFIGSRVARALIDSGHRVTCLLRATSDRSRLAGLPVNIVFGDVRNFLCLKQGMEGCRAVLHMAGPSAWNEIDSPDMHEIVVGGTRNVLRAAAEAGNLRTVYVSSVVAVNGTSGPEISTEDSTWSLARCGLSYATAKRAAEAECMAAVQNGMPVVVVNPTEVYGADDRKLVTAGNLIDFANSQTVLVCNGGVNVVHVDDVAAGILAALFQGRPGERYLLGGDNLTIRELAETTLKLLGVSRRVVTIPNVIARLMTSVATLLRIPLPYNPHVVQYATRYWYVSAEKARRELGVTFRSSRETLASVLGWLQSAGHITCGKVLSDPAGYDLPLPHAKTAAFANSAAASSRLLRVHAPAKCDADSA